MRLTHGFALQVRRLLAPLTTVHICFSIKPDLHEEKKICTSSVVFFFVSLMYSGNFLRSPLITYNKKFLAYIHQRHKKTFGIRHFLRCPVDA